MPTIHRTPQIFLVESNNDIYICAPSIGAALAYTLSFIPLPELIEGTPLDGIIAGEKHLYIISPDIPSVLAICWILHIMRLMPELLPEMERIWQTFAVDPHKN
jgi:hypothetical protein